MVGSHPQPGHLPTLANLALADDGNIILRVTGNGAGAAADATLHVNDHCPTVRQIFPLGIQVPLRFVALRKGHGQLLPVPGLHAAHLGQGYPLDKLPMPLLSGQGRVGGIVDPFSSHPAQGSPGKGNIPLPSPQEQKWIGSDPPGDPAHGGVPLAKGDCRRLPRYLIGNPDRGADGPCPGFQFGHLAVLYLQISCCAAIDIDPIAPGNKGNRVRRLLDPAPICSTTVKEHYGSPWPDLDLPCLPSRLFCSGSGDRQRWH